MKNCTAKIELRWGTGTKGKGNPFVRVTVHIKKRVKAVFGFSAGRPDRTSRVLEFFHRHFGLSWENREVETDLRTLIQKLENEKLEYGLKDLYNGLKILEILCIGGGSKS